MYHVNAVEDLLSHNTRL